MSKKSTIFFLLTIALQLLVSCAFNPGSEKITVIDKRRVSDGNGIEIPDKSFQERKWNLLVYMSADNNLESSALEDFYEMEYSRLDTSTVSVFILIDRSEAYDTSEGNWSDTKLYQLRTGRTKDDKNLISQEIECPDLGLSIGTKTELDMSSGYVLATALTYVREKFPAENYGLLMWGHGTGWRSEEDTFYKGFAYDDSSSTYMTLKQLGTALHNSLDNQKLNFIGFDTCFGGELEIMYEIKDYADFVTASEGLVMSSGWNYTVLFDLFQKSSSKKTEDLCVCASEQFKRQYANTTRASIVSVDLSKMEAFDNAFDNVTSRCASLIKDKNTRNEIMGVLYTSKNCKTEKYSYGSDKSDVYIDVSSMVEALSDYFDSALTTEKETFSNAAKKLFLTTWASDRESGGLGVYFSSLTSGNLLSTVHPAAYIKNKTLDQIKFVETSNGYVPTKDGNVSLLDKLFYEEY